MAAHLTGTAAPVTGTLLAGPWLKLSAALTEELPDLADREDLIVACAPGAGHGAPGCFIPALATVELDATHLGVPPETCDPSRPSDRDRYPILWGVLVHEAAHARHTSWTPPRAALGTAATKAALMLEESRVEKAHLARRPGDRHWLRVMAATLILADLTPPTTAASPTPATSAPATPAVGMTPWKAAYTAGLILARVDAGTLNTHETAALTTTIRTILGAHRLAELHKIWLAAHTTGDDDQTGMLDLGRRWCDILSADSDKAPPASEPPGEGEGPSPLASAIAATLGAVTAAETPRPAGASHKASTRAAETTARKRSAAAARRVFHDDASSSRVASSPVTGTRRPTPAEQAAARHLARLLRAAAHRERVTTTTTSATPPGRLRMRGALAADAQRAAGTTPTAEPFTRTHRRHVPSPPLRVGIACDVSGSMDALAAPVASAAWILARAVSYIPDASSATVTFGESVHPITHPGHTPTRVREFAARDRTERFCEATDALDAALDLTRPGAARLLVIVSDGIFTANETSDGQRRITRLTKSGCAVLWIGLGTVVFPLDGAHTIALTDPARAAAEIGKAATHVLTHTP